MVFSSFHLPTGKSKWLQPGYTDPTITTRSTLEGYPLPDISAQPYKALGGTGNDHTPLPTDLLPKMLRGTDEPCRARGGHLAGQGTGKEVLLAECVK